MSMPIGQFLAELAVDPNKYEEFIQDPDGSMGAAQLAPADQAAIKSGDGAAIQARLSTGGNGAATDSNCLTYMVWAASAAAAKR